jgi:long-chain acyl-CoA synthetase
MLVGEGKPYLSGLFLVDEIIPIPMEIYKFIQDVNHSLSRPEQVKGGFFFPMTYFY